MRRGENSADSVHECTVYMKRPSFGLARDTSASHIDRGAITVHPAPADSGGDQHCAPLYLDRAAGHPRRLAEPEKAVGQLVQCHCLKSCPLGSESEV